jgi:hypothetical protein
VQPQQLGQHTATRRLPLLSRPVGNTLPGARQPMHQRPTSAALAVWRGARPSTGRPARRWPTHSPPACPCLRGELARPLLCLPLQLHLAEVTRTPGLAVLVLIVVVHANGPGVLAGSGVCVRWSGADHLLRRLRGWGGNGRGGALIQCGEGITVSCWVHQCSGLNAQQLGDLQ